MNKAIKGIIEQVDKSQSTTAKRKALAGSTRAFSLVWQKKMAEIHKQARTHFTDKDLGNVRQLIEWFGAKEALELAEWAIENWEYLKRVPYLGHLPPAPFFSTFFFQ